MKKLAKTLLACSVTACFMVTSVAGAATINPFNPFKFTPLAATKIKTFDADRISGTYVERATFKANGTFDVSLFWKATSFVNDGVTLDAEDTGLGSAYRMYGLYKASGTYLTVGTKTTFTFASTPIPDPKNFFRLYVDNGTTLLGTKTLFPASATPSDGEGPFVFTNAGDDVLVEDGYPSSGMGTLDTGPQTCGAGGINCGSFGSSTHFALTPAGEGYFSSPTTTFYDKSFQSGQLTTFIPSGTQTINGSLDLSFPNSVPEPATTVLFGLGLLGVSLTRLRKKS